MSKIFAVILLLLMVTICALASGQMVKDWVDQDSIGEPTSPHAISTKANDTFIIENVMASNVDESTNDVIKRSRIFFTIMIAKFTHGCAWAKLVRAQLNGCGIFLTIICTKQCP